MKAELLQARACLAQFAPGRYSPEMTDDEVKALILTVFGELKPVFEKLNAAFTGVWQRHLDDVLFEVNDILQDARSRTG